MTLVLLKGVLFVLAAVLITFIASLFVHLPGDDETLDDGNYDHGGLDHEEEVKR
jgi:hypothetical protein